MKRLKFIKLIVPGGLNTDIIGLGVERIIGQGELTLGGRLQVGPGGKARNMAQMAARYLGKGTVAMIGRTTDDPYGLGRVPVEALDKAGVDTRYVRRVRFSAKNPVFPGIALIPVDVKGRNQIYVLPGVNADFGKADIDKASPLFRSLGSDGVMLMALEIPLPAVRYAVDKAYAAGIRVVLDPGGMTRNIPALVNKKLFLLKPNEHEARMLTGVNITGFAAAERAARKLMRKGVRNVMITHGGKGAYLFTPDGGEHIPVPRVKRGAHRDETGCGDQVSSVLAACLAEGRTVAEAARLAVRAGTLQFNRAGIQPVSRRELTA